ncbi:MAG: alginate export family protein [Nitrospirota bacterium]|nr:MAG: alginate export family protein [Nitrospirota bacterium]
MTRLRRLKKSNNTGFLSRAGKTLIALLLFSLIFGFLARTALAEGADPQNNTNKTNVTHSGFTEYLLETIKEAPNQPWRGTADQILFPESQVRWTRYLHYYSRLPDWIDVGVDFRARFNVMTNPFRKGEFGTTDQLPLRTRFRFGMNGEIFRFLLEFQDSRAIGANEGELISDAIFNETELQQIFLSATFDNLFGRGLRNVLHFGRINMDFGHRRLIARNRFRNTTNAFDGLHWNLGQGQVWRLRTFLVRPTPRTFGVFNQLFEEDDTLFWGTHFESNHIPTARTNLYYYGLNDDDPDISKQRVYSTFGLRLYRTSRKGLFDYELEGAYQFGRRAEKDQQAWFGHATVGYTFDAMWQPRLLFQYDYASGTRDPFGNTSQTFDTLFGARRFEYTPTGIFGPFFRSNISSPGVRLVLWPKGDVKMNVKYRWWWLAQSRDAWVGSGLQDPTGRAGNELGSDFEIQWEWFLTSFISFDAGYDHFFKGSYIEALAQVPGNPPADDTDYVYFSTELKF